MMYRVGWQCVSKQQAEDLVLSALPPAYLPDGTLTRPEMVGGKWYYRGQPVKLDFPECSPSEQMAEGAYHAGMLLLVLALAFSFRRIYGLIFSIGSGHDDH